MDAFSQADERLAEFRLSPIDSEELKPGGTLRIGRHKDNDLVIHDTTVSRFHATVRWDPELERPILYDNGSQNGSVVDGKEIRNKAVALSHGTEIEISNHVISVELKNCGETPAVLKNATDMVTLFSDQGPDVKGTLGVDGSVRELLQRLEIERRSGTLRLDLQDGPASATMCLGKIMAVNLPTGERGMHALGILLSGSTQGSFHFTRELEPTDHPLDLWFSDYLRQRDVTGQPTRHWKRRGLLGKTDKDAEDETRKTETSRRRNLLDG